MSRRKRLDRDRILTQSDDLEDVVGLLLESAINPRQLWLLFLDADDRLTDLVMPCDDYPDDPDEPRETGDLGCLDGAHVLAHRVREIIEITDADSLVLVWERSGSATFEPDERRWARAMSAACGDVGVPIRSQLVLHDTGVRPITPDDYLAAGSRP